uniref:Integrase core domain containing protein n=1 Tax=Solanum tuberosum TaxID=4113 RepID=M1DBL1_SOLTU
METDTFNPTNSVRYARFYRGEGPRRYFQKWTEHNDHEEYQTQLSDSPTSRGSDNSPRVNDLLTRIIEKVEGSDDLLKGMRDDFSSLNSKVNSHANAIKMLEGQLNLLSAQLTTKIPKENEEEELAVITRSGKVAIDRSVDSERTVQIGAPQVYSVTYRKNRQAQDIFGEPRTGSAIALLTVI